MGTDCRLRACNPGNTVSMRDAILIGRLKSRRGGEDFQHAQSVLAQRGIRITQSHTVETKKELTKRLKQAIKSGCGLIIVSGGDGTQTTAVASFAEKKVTLGVIPAGTGNSFAHSLGIGSDFERAIEAIVNGKEIKADLGIVNGTYFANFATIGLAAEIADETPNLLKRITGPVAYGLAGIKPMLTHQAFNCTVKWKHNVLKLETHQAIIANGRYYGHEALTPSATIVDGELAFFATTGTSRLDILRQYTALIRGDQTQMRDAHYFTAKKITVKTSVPEGLSIDGCLLGKTPAEFSVARKALRVMVPHDFPEGT